MIGAEPTPVARTPGGRRRERGRHVLPVAIVVVLVALVAALGLLFLGDRGGEGRDVSATPPATSARPSSGQTPTTPSTPSTPTPPPTSAPAPDTADMQQFVRDYVATAAASPDAGFRLLTPAYGLASGGISGYREEFWGNVRSARVIGNPEADPDTLSVQYTYQYTLRNGTTQEEEVALNLVYDASTDTYLIDGDDGST